MFCHLLPTALFAVNQWIGVSSQSPAPSKIISSGSIQTSVEISVEIPGFYLQEKKYDGKSSMQAQLQDGHPIMAKDCPDLQKLSFTLQLPAEGNMGISVLTQ